MRAHRYKLPHSDLYEMRCKIGKLGLLFTKKGSPKWEY